MEGSPRPCELPGPSAEDGEPLFAVELKSDTARVLLRELRLGARGKVTQNGQPQHYR